MVKLFKKLSFLFLLCFTVQATAQDYIGFRAGANFANISISGDDGFSLTPDRILGLNATFFAEFNLGENISVQPEVAFIQKGYRFKIDFFGDEEDTSVRVNYIDIPILFKYSFGGESIGGHIGLGPHFGYAMSGTINDHVEDEKMDLDFDDAEFNRLDYGIAIGTGIKLPAGSGHFVADLRYLLGIANLVDSEFDESTARNRGINLSVGYAFSIGGGIDE